MRKIFTIFLAATLVFFTLPLNTLTTQASEKIYHIQDGEYTITAKAINIDTGAKSGAAGFINEEAKLIIENGEIYFTITIPHNDFAMISGVQIEGIEPTVESGENVKYYTYHLPVLKSELVSQVQYQVPALNMDHDVPFKFVLEELDDLPEANAGSEPPADQDDDQDTSDPVDHDLPGEDDDPSDDGETDEPDDESNSNQNGDDPETTGDHPGSDDNSAIELANGSYFIDVSYMRIDDDRASVMARYLGDTVFVTVDDDLLYVTLTVNDHRTVTRLEVDGNKSIVAKLNGNKRYETFKVDRLGVIRAEVDYQAPFGNSIHYGNADFRIIFDDIENVVEADRAEQPGYDIQTVLLNLDDGFYTSSVSYLRSDDDNASSMGHYLGDTVFFTVKDGIPLLTLTVNSSETVTKLQVNGEDAIEQVIDGNKRYETFELPDLQSIANGYVEYQIDNYKGNAHFRIAFDLDNINETDETDKPGTDVDESPQDPKQPTNPTQPPAQPTPGESKDENGNRDVGDDLKQEDALVPDKVYTINFVILHENGSDESIANQFFISPGLLLEKDGQKYVHLTITNGELIRSLSNQFGDYLLVRTNNDGSIVIQLRVNDDLSDMLLDMHVVVPPMPGFPGYDEQHKAILALDIDSRAEIDVGDHLLVATGDANNGNGPFVEGKTPPKPSLEEVDNDGIEQENGKPNNNDNENGTKTENPKTGDTTNLLLYSLLLVSSAIPLGIKFRRRFA